MATPSYAEQQALIQDELFDLDLYRGLSRFSSTNLVILLNQLIAVETEHVAFWKKLFDQEATTLSPRRQVLLQLHLLFARIFGEKATFLLLEAREVHGIQKYLNLWNDIQGTPLENAVRRVLEDEFRHEDAIVTTQNGRLIQPEQVRNIILGLNDGLVEMIGSISGLFASLHNPRLVFIASLMIAFAGAFSMGAGALASVHSEREIQRIEQLKHQFLTGKRSGHIAPANAVQTFFQVSASYLLGALVPIIPIAFGAHVSWISILLAIILSVITSTFLALISGMNIKKRIFLNLGILLAAVLFSYAVGTISQAFLGTNAL